MKIHRRSHGVFEAEHGKMWLRLSPHTDQKTYRLSIRRRKDNGYASSRIIFELDNPDDLGAIAVMLHELYEQIATAGLQA